MNDETPSKLVATLVAGTGFPHPVERVRLFETHISWVLLTGQFAYKIKKPVVLDFLDFSTLDRRRHFCEEELRLNRRMAPELYLGVVPITGSPETPSVEGGGEPIEYAVKMVQFPDSARLDHRLEAGQLDARAMRAFGRALAQIHDGADRRQSQRYGEPDAVAGPMLENLEQLRALLAPAEAAPVPALERWTRTELSDRREFIAHRAAEGKVRECHGDLHLSNLVALDEGITAFDCLEFDPQLRWIDVIDDVAFLLMDLELRDQQGLGYAFLDSYLADAGDYLGVQLLDLYRVYRSLVRAKVAGIGRSLARGSEQAELQAKVQRHLQLATRYIEKRSPVLVLMHGLSGSGKSWLAERLVPLMPAIRLRSDVERKRLAGLEASARSDSPLGAGLYDPESTARTYGRLLELAQALIASGHSAIVDATFLARARREPFYAAAREAGVRCVLVACDAPYAVLEQRVIARSKQGDASEADLEVLRAQVEQMERPSSGEDASLVTIDTSHGEPLTEIVARILRTQESQRGGQQSRVS